MELALMMRCCAKAIYKLECAGLQNDAEQIRKELAGMDINIKIVRDQDEFGLAKKELGIK